MKTETLNVRDNQQTTAAREPGRLAAASVAESPATISTHPAPATRCEPGRFARRGLAAALVGLALLAGTELALAQGTYLSAPDGDPVRAVDVDNNGYVSIGTLAQPVGLNLNGIMEVHGNQSAIHHKDSSGGARFLTGLRDDISPAQNFVFHSYGGNWVFNNGDVGLAVASPRDRLEVNGIIRLSQGNKQILFSDDGNYDFSIVHNGGGSLDIRSPEFNGGTTIASFFNNGSVGIGTTSPQGTLHVLHPSRPDALVISKAVADSPRMLIGQGPGGDSLDQYFFSSSKSPGGNFIPMTFWTSDRERLRLDVDGNVGIGTLSPQAKLDVNGKINCTVLELTSDRNQKQDFAAVDARQILDRLAALPIQTWAYTNDASARHIGPMAQDWKAAYPELGSDDKHIAAGDLASVALAAVQAVNAKLVESSREKDARIAELERKLAAQEQTFSARFDKLEKVMAQTAPGFGVPASAGRAPLHSEGFETAPTLPAKAGTPSADAR